MKRLWLILPSFAGGGAERVALTLVAGLDHSRLSAEVVVLADDGPLRGEVPDEVAVRAVGRPRLRRALLPLVRMLRAARPDAVLSTFGYVNLALLALRPLLPVDTKLVIREANTPSLALGEGRAPALTALAYRLLYPTADLVLCQHEGMARELVGRFGVAAERVRLLPNPVDVERLRAGAPVREPGPGRRFVAAGRLTRQKGFDRLLRLFTTTDPADRLTVLGEGPERAPLETLARDLGIEDKVRLPGFAAEPGPFYAGADAVLVPSRWEGLPNVALEALACGTPVIATAQTGGLVEVAAEVAGAVTIAAWGEAFAGAVARVAPAPVAARPSLLPARYARQSVIRRFQALVDSL